MIFSSVKLSFDFPFREFRNFSGIYWNELEPESYTSLTLFTIAHIGKNPLHMFFWMNVRERTQFACMCACVCVLLSALDGVYYMENWENHIPILSSVIVVCSVISSLNSVLTSASWCPNMNEHSSTLLKYVASKTNKNTKTRIGEKLVNILLSQKLCKIRRGQSEQNSGQLIN